METITPVYKIIAGLIILAYLGFIMAPAISWDVWDQIKKRFGK